jgi:hypothetical protein
VQVAFTESTSWLTVIAILIIRCPDNRVLATNGHPSTLPARAGMMLSGSTLEWAKAEACSLFPRQAPEAWAAVRAADSDNLASPTFHGLVACAPHDAAPPGWAWKRPAEISAARPDEEAWIRAAADAVAVVRQMPPPARGPHAQPPHDEA